MWACVRKMPSKGRRSPARSREARLVDQIELASDVRRSVHEVIPVAVRIDKREGCREARVSPLSGALTAIGVAPHLRHAAVLRDAEHEKVRIDPTRVLAERRYHALRSQKCGPACACRSGGEHGPGTNDEFPSRR